MFYVLKRIMVYTQSVESLLYKSHWTPQTSMNPLEIWLPSYHHGPVDPPCLALFMDPKTSRARRHSCPLLQALINALQPMTSALTPSARMRSKSPAAWSGKAVVSLTWIKAIHSGMIPLTNPNLWLGSEVVVNYPDIWDKTDNHWWLTSGLN